VHAPKAEVSKKEEAPDTTTPLKEAVPEQQQSKPETKP